MTTDFNTSFMKIEPRLREVLAELEESGLYFNVHAMPYILNPDTGLLESPHRTEMTQVVLERASEQLVPLVTLMQDLAEYLGLEGENLSLEDMDELLTRAIKHYHGSEIPL